MKNNISYNADWKKLSKKILSERPKCELCAIRGIDNKSEQVHHVFKFAEQIEEDLAKDLMLDENNCLALCKRCHTNIHKRPYYIWPEQSDFINKRKYNISQKYLDAGKIILWIPDEHPKIRKNKF